MFSPSTGFGMTDVAALLDRGVLGTFFVISGFHKLFNPVRRAALAGTFKEDGCYNPAMMTAIPLGEFMGGAALLLGFLTPLAAVGLMAICGGACALDGLKRIRAWGPLDRFDWLDDLLYLPEVLYVAMLALLILIGPGQFSADSALSDLIR